MELSSILASCQTPSVLEPEVRRTVNSGPISGGSGDTVTFSQEALRLAEAMQDGGRTAFGAVGVPDAAEAPEDVSSGEGLPSAGEALAEQIQKIEEMLEDLYQQVAAIMSGPGTVEDKTQKAAPVQQKIQSLEGQLRQLQAEAREQARASV